MNALGRAFNWFTAHPFVAGGIFIVLLVSIVIGGNWLVSRRYDKERLKYEVDSRSWATERALLLGQVAERDRQIEQLQAKEAAIIAADKAGKKVDDALAAKIDAVTKAAADEAITTDQPADCWLRGDRTCAKLRELRPPIVIDCDVYKRKVCAK